jgi:uncharacterized SAM-binding protein YcdF (DUF218 family)
MAASIVELVQPLPLGFVLASLIWLAAWWRHHAWRSVLARLYIPWLLLGLICVPAVAFLAAGSLEWWYPPVLTRPEHAEAIVILGGGSSPADGSKELILADDSIRRCLAGAKLYRSGQPCPVFVSGGKMHREDPDASLAGAMSELLERLGVPPADIVHEDVSTDTHENAVETAKLLRERKITRIVLVTDAAHLWRATLCFEREGIEVTPAGANYRAKTFEPRPGVFLPQARGARDMQAVFHEYVGLAWYWANGWL